MATSLLSGWTVAKLLPTLAAGFSPGMSVGSRAAPAQVASNPVALKPALEQSRGDLLKKILGQNQATVAATKQPGANLAVNSPSTSGLTYAGGII